MPRRWQALSLSTQTFTGVKKHNTFSHWNIHLQPRLISVGRDWCPFSWTFLFLKFYLSGLFLVLFLTLSLLTSSKFKNNQNKGTISFIDKQGSVLILLLFLFYDFRFLRPLLLGPLFSHGKYFHSTSFQTLFFTHILLQLFQPDKSYLAKGLTCQWRP